MPLSTSLAAYSNDDCLCVLKDQLSIRVIGLPEANHNLHAVSYIFGRDVDIVEDIGV